MHILLILTEMKDMHVSGGLHGMLTCNITGKAGNDRFVRGASLAVRCFFPGLIQVLRVSKDQAFLARGAKKNQILLFSL